jgi:toxin CcdB
MAQFDLYANPDPEVRDDLPYVVDVQVDFLGTLPSRVLVPLGRPDVFAPAGRLMPILPVGDQRLVLITPQMVSLPARLLDDPVGSLAEWRHDIVAALDFLFTGI